MEKIKCCSEAIPIAIIAIAMSMNYMASAQITTACTSSLISSFTPCLNFITGSTNGGGSPTSGCCDAVDSLITSSTDCTCLILTGNVPFNLPINRTLAITLPQLCNSQSVPLQCKATAAPLPSPGPVAYAPGLPPLPPFSGTGSDDVPPAPAQSEPPAPAQSELPASPPAIAESPENPGLNQGQRPLVLPNSAVKHSPALLLGVVLGIGLLNKT